MTELWRKSATELAGMIASKAISSTEVVDAHLARIAAVNPSVNAVVRVLAEGVESGEFRHVDSDYVWRIIVAPMLLSIIWKHSFQVFEPEPLDFRRHLEAQLDLLFDGLATDSNKLRAK